MRVYPCCRSGRDDQEEGDEQQRQEERQQCLANDIAVEQRRHHQLDYHYDPRRPPVAHAPAVLRRPRHPRAHHAVGAAACAEGLLRDGGAAARVPGCSRHLQPGTVAARPTRSLRRRPRARPVSRARAQAGGAPHRGGSHVHRRQLLSRAAPAHDRNLPALPRAARTALGVRAVLDRRPARSAGLAEARLDRPVLPDGRRTRAAAGRQGARLLRGRQRGASGRGARDPEPRHPGVPRRRSEGPDRDRHVALLPPDSAAPVRYGRLPADASGIGDAAPAISAPAGRGPSAPAGRGVPRASVRTPAGRRVAF